MSVHIKIYKNMKNVLLKKGALNKRCLSPLVWKFSILSLLLTKCTPQASGLFVLVRQGLNYSTTPQVPDNSLTPVKTYLNADTEKKSVYEDNRKKCGVYR